MDRLWAPWRLSYVASAKPAGEHDPCFICAGLAEQNDRDNLIAFARHHGREAAIIAVAKSFAAFSESGRTWPRGELFDGALHLNGYSLEGTSGKAATTEVRLSALFEHLPAAVLKARFEGAVKPARKRGRT